MGEEKPAANEEQSPENEGNCKQMLRGANLKRAKLAFPRGFQRMLNVERAKHL